jgi:hypothetical protein
MKQVNSSKDQRRDRCLKQGAMRQLQPHKHKSRVHEERSCLEPHRCEPRSYGSRLPSAELHLYSCKRGGLQQLSFCMVLDVVQAAVRVC